MRRSTSECGGAAPSSCASDVTLRPTIPQDDLLEVAQVGGDVERKAVLRHAAGAELDANRGDLCAADPHAGQPCGAVGHNAIASQRDDDRLLQHPQVAQHIAAVARELEDRVADDLAGAVVGDVAAAVGF